MTTIPYSPKKRKELTVLSNKHMEIGLSKEKGNLKELCLKRKGFGKWNGWESYLIIVDELKAKIYKDTEDSFILSQKKHRNDFAGFTKRKACYS